MAKRHLGPWVKLRIGEPIEKGLRILKKKVDKEGILKASKKKRYYHKPSVAKRIKQKEALRTRR